MTAKIREEDGLQAAWYVAAKKQTVDTLPDFVRSLTTEWGHDYGTIAHASAVAAIAAASAVAAIAAASAVDHSPTGGVTGSQAECITWLFIEHFMGKTGPMRLIEYGDMLYPQYRERFAKTISGETAKWLRKEAAKRLLGDGEIPPVRAHLYRVATGEIPFGYTVVGNRY